MEFIKFAASLIGLFVLLLFVVCTVAVTAVKYVSWLSKKIF